MIALLYVSFPTSLNSIPLKVRSRAFNNSHHVAWMLPRHCLRHARKRFLLELLRFPDTRTQRMGIHVDLSGNTDLCSRGILFNQSNCFSLKVPFYGVAPLPSWSPSVGITFAGSVTLQPSVFCELT